MWHKFRSILHFAAYWQLTLLLFILYLLIVVPLGLVQKLLHPQKPATTYWQDFKENYQTIHDLGEG